MLYTIPVQNKEILFFSAVCQLISKRNILFYSALKIAIFCIYIMFLVHNFFNFSPRNSAISQQNEILFVVLKPILSDRYMVPMVSLVYLFYFLMISWLLSKKRVDFVYLWCSFVSRFQKILMILYQSGETQI
jgi:hypothetical protein